MKNSPGPDDLNLILLTIQGRINANPSQTLPKNRKGGDSLQLILGGQYNTVTKTKQKHQRKENFGPILLQT